MRRFEEQPGDAMTLNTGFYLQIYTFITLILCGLVQYFTGMQAVLWLPFCLALVMVGLLVMQTRDGTQGLDDQETIILAVYCSSWRWSAFRP